MKMLIQLKRSLPRIGLEQMKKVFNPPPSQVERKVDKDLLPTIETPTYKLGELIGEGTFGKVYVGQKRGGYGRYRQRYAIKVCDLVEKEDQPKEEEQDCAEEQDGDVLEVQAKLLDLPFYKEDAFQGAWRVREENAPKAGEEKEIVLPTSLETILGELKVFDRLQKSPYVVKVYASFQIKRSDHDWNGWIVMECMKIGLDDVIEATAGVSELSKEERMDNNLSKQISLETCACIILEILKGLKSLRSHRVVHRDIKPGNILISSIGKVKLCDFGISTIIEEGQSYAIVESISGTPQYMASELVRVGQRFDYSADIWSVGVVLFTMFRAGKMPWRSKEPREQYFDHHYLWGLWEKSSELYFERALCDGFLTGNEYLASLKVTQPGDFEWADKRYKRYFTPIAKVVRKAMVPQPKHGPDGNIHREGLIDRITLEEFIEWCEDKLKAIPELKRRPRVQNWVKSRIRCKEYLASKREAEQAKNSKELEITL